jgi:hypothetical protein
MGPTADSLGSVQSVRARRLWAAVLPVRISDTSASGTAMSAIRLWAGTIGGVLRSGLATLLVCAVLTPAARAFEWCPNALGPAGGSCPDGWACCPYPYGPGYWC